VRTPEVSAPEPTGWLPALIALAILTLLIIASGLVAIVVQWVCVVAFCIRNEHWVWLLVCLFLKYVGSTLAYLCLRKSFSPVSPDPRGGAHEP
jgi:hypothetical protein